MRILLISPEQNYPTQWEMYPSGALLTLGTIWKNAGHEVRIVHIIADKINDRELRSILYSWKPHLVGITCTTFQLKGTKRIAEIVKTISPKTNVIVGGPHPSLIGENMLEDTPNIDKIVVGEAEQLNLEEIRTPKRTVLHVPPLKDLDTLPMLDMSLINLSHFKGGVPPGPNPGAFIMASRGCPFDCIFCSKCFNRTVRHKSVEKVIEEIAWLKKTVGVKEIFFQDDTLNLKPKWTTDLFCNIINKGHNDILYRAPFRVNKQLITPDLLRLAKKAGMWLIFYGVENGNQAMLDTMKKGITLEEIKRAFQLTHKAGIKTEASFIIGLPGENGLTIIESYELWQALKPFWTGFSRAIPFPGSEFYEYVKEKGHLLSLPFEDYSPNKVMARTENLSSSELETYYEWITKKVWWSKLANLIKNPTIGWKVYRRELYK